MAGMQETDRLTMKNGITYLLQDAKARAQLAELLAEVMEKYGADNPPPYPVTSVNGQTGEVNIPTVDLPVSVQDGGTGATTAAQAAKNLGVLPLGEVATQIPSGANLNDYGSPGVYAVDTYTIALTIANIPSKNAGTLRVFASVGRAIIASSTWKYLIQEYITMFGKRYYRYGGSESGTAVTWDAWQTVYDSSDFPLSVTKGAAGSYTPIFSYTGSGQTLTVENIDAKYFLFGGHVCVVSMRFNITNLGTHANNENFYITLPNDVKPTLNTVSPVGVYYTSDGVSNLVARASTNGLLYITNGIGGNYSASVLTTGYQGLFAVIVF